MRDLPAVVMVGPSPGFPGGISAVVNHWLDAGLSRLVDLRYISTLDEQDARLPARKLYSAGRAYCSIAARLATNPPDILHVHLSTGASFYRKLGIFRLARLRSVRTVVHLHGSTFEEFYRDGNRVQARLIRWMFDNADAVVVLSSSWRDFVRGISANPGIHILHNGVASGKFGPRQGGGGEIVITSMGRLGKRKGTYDLIEAFRRLSGEVPEARLVLGGDGEIREARALVERYGLADRVSIPGWMSGERKIDAFNRADIYVLPSYNEGLPGSILEAMAAATPVVSTPVGGIPEAVIDGDNGFLVAPGDVDELTERLRRLCTDAGLRERMGRRSREIVDETFDIETLVADLTALYRRMLAVDRVSGAAREPG